MSAIADTTQPRTAKRLLVFDPERKKLVLPTRVADGHREPNRTSHVLVSTLGASGHRL